MTACDPMFEPIPACKAAALRSEQEGAYERSLRLDKAKTEVAEAEADRKKVSGLAAKWCCDCVAWL